MIKVAVLRGGKSAEREVSLSTGRQIVAALNKSKYAVSEMDTDDLPALAVLPKAERPDVVFIALHGPGGEDGTVQGFLDVLGICYTGSGVLASALAMDKIRWKQFFTNIIEFPMDITFLRGDEKHREAVALIVRCSEKYPVVVKPSRQGSTYGTSVVRTNDELVDALALAFRYDSEVLVEERLVGREITVAVLGNHKPFALPVVEIVAKNGFFDYESKYSESGAEEVVPARLTAEQTEEAQEIAILCHEQLGCRGMSRTDMFVTKKGIITLETNTIPGMTATSLLPKAAKAAGIEFSDLMDKIIGYALEAD